MSEMTLLIIPPDTLLILHFTADVKDIYEQGKRYPWPKSTECPRCRYRRLWGHGFAERYFEGFSQAIWVKRYRCPDCHGVHTCRPDTYFERTRYPVPVVLASLLEKIMRGTWLRWINRQIQLWWYRSVTKWVSKRRTVRSLTVWHLKEYLFARLPRTGQCAPLRL